MVRAPSWRVAPFFSFLLQCTNRSIISPCALNRPFASRGRRRAGMGVSWISGQTIYEADVVKKEYSNKMGARGGGGRGA
jgi:hypothetical protein